MPRHAPGLPGAQGVFRWECRCQAPPVLLGTRDARGCINIKSRDRYWRVTGGVVTTVCPLCGSSHALGPAGPPIVPEA